MSTSSLSGRRLAAYEIGPLIGAGGMGEVYRATDTRLQRTVAIKVLPPSLAEDPQFRARFDREAKSIAALNHPHICTLHDIGSDGGTSYLVMEYVEGETLAARLARSAIPFEQAMTWAIEIADALAAAHRAGIVHRDLKPGNVMITRTGTKLLDFGLAKADAPVVAQTMLSTAPPVTVAASSGEVPLTARGMILGTLQYMAPEQLEGRAVDSRTDVFAFGGLVYELFTGTRAFGGASQASVIGAILHADPPPMALRQQLTPAPLERLVRTCLAKDPDERWQSMRDVTRELRQIKIAPSASDVPSASPTVPAQTRSRAWSIAAVLLGITVGAAAVGAWMYSRPSGVASESPLIRFSIAPPPVNGQPGRFRSAPGNSVGILVPPLALSPDGRLIAFASDSPEGMALWLRPVEGEARLLPGTNELRYPFWSHDSRTLAYFTQQSLMVIDVAGGRPRPLAASFENGVGGAWLADGTIYAAKQDGVWRLSPDQQPVRILISDAENEWRFPQALPSVEQVLVWNRRRSAAFVVRSDGSQPIKVLDADRAVVYRDGWLLFSRGQSVFAQAFDPSTLSPSGPPRSLPVRVQPSGSGYLPLAVSDTGVLVASAGERLLTQLTWVDRGGRDLSTVGEVTNQGNASLSRDENRIAITRTDLTDNNITVIIDRSRNDAAIRLGSGGNAILSPDGTRVAMNVIMQGVLSGPADGSPAELIYSGIGWPTDWFDGASSLILQTPDFGGGMDLGILDLLSRKFTPVVASPANDASGKLSPNQRWLAYVSDASSRFEVYLSPLADPTRRLPVSFDGGFSPRWRADGRELYFQTADGQTLMSVDVTWVGDEPRPSKPVVLFKTGELTGDRNFMFAGGYAPSSDGKRFLLTRVTKRTPGVVDLLVNWKRALSE